MLTDMSSYSPIQPRYSCSELTNLLQPADSRLIEPFSQREASGFVALNGSNSQKPHIPLCAPGQEAHQTRIYAQPLPNPQLVIKW